MKETVNFSRFEDGFKKSNREDQFTRNGLRALFDYLEQYEEETGEEIELDVVAICCEYSEYESLKDLQKEYPDIKNMDDLRDQTTVIEFNGGIIIQPF
jgi:hypothetical protein